MSTLNIQRNNNYYHHYTDVLILTRINLHREIQSPQILTDLQSLAVLVKIRDSLKSLIHLGNSVNNSN